MFVLPQIAVLALLFAATAGPTPGAQKQADDVIQKGNELRRRGDNYGAFEYFRQAHDLAPTPKTAAQLGLAEQATGRWADAEGHLTDALRDTQNAWIKKNREVLRQALEDAHVHVGRVEIVGDPPKASVLVNGKVVGSMPLAAPIAVNAGNVDVEVSADGFITERRSINAPAQQVQTLVIRLEPVKRVPSLVLTNPTPPSPASEQTLSATPAEEQRPSQSRTLLWVGVGAVLVAAAITGVLLATRSDEYPTSKAEVSW